MTGRNAARPSVCFAERPFGPQPELEAEVQQPDLHLLNLELAKVLDLEQVRPFLPAGYGSALPLPARSCGKKPFITALPAESRPEAAGRGGSQGPGAGAGHCRCGAGV